MVCMSSTSSFVMNAGIAMRLAHAVGAGVGRSPRCFSSAAGWICTETPNPNVRKFELSKQTTASVTTAAASGLVQARGRLLELEGVGNVFVANAPNVEQASSQAPWVAVTREENVQWDSLAPRVQAFLLQLPGEVGGNVPNIADSNVSSEASSSKSGSDAVTTEIEEVLLHRVRPAVQADGGDVELFRWEADIGRVVLRMQGACRGCPQSAVTLQDNILRTLKHFIPDVRSVVAVEEELSAENLAADLSADLPWLHDGQPDPDTINALAKSGTPFFSVFAGTQIQGPKLRRVRFMSRCELNDRTPEHILIKCQDCKKKATIEDPQDLLRPEKGNTTGNAAVVICPTCCIVISP